MVFVLCSDQRREARSSVCLPPSPPRAGRTAADVASRLTCVKKLHMMILWVKFVFSSSHSVQKLASKCNNMTYKCKYVDLHKCKILRHYVCK